jgi:hypothetical protein
MEHCLLAPTQLTLGLQYYTLDTAPQRGVHDETQNNNNDGTRVGLLTEFWQLVLFLGC